MQKKLAQTAHKTVLVQDLQDVVVVNVAVLKDKFVRIMFVKHFLHLQEGDYHHAILLEI
jgi:hypothetical protein